MRLRFIFEHRR